MMVPGGLSMTTSLGPYETRELTLEIPPDFGFLAHEIQFHAEPAIEGPVEIRIKPSQTSEIAVAQEGLTVGADLLEMLDGDLPDHLAEAAGETLEEWAKRNEELKSEVLRGNEDAFFEVLGRDPRVIRSPLTLAKLVT